MVNQLIEIKLALSEMQDENNNLKRQIAELEQATRITDVQFTDDGDLLITFGDGSTQTIKAPQQHVHTFGKIPK